VEGNLVGAEALSRWKHPVRNLLLPKNYIDILERTGLLYKLDEFMFDKAYKLLADWQAHGLNDLFVSVNVSYKDIFYMDIYKYVLELNDKYKINPKNLRFEFPE
jgi:EAL domain-containing protein (putative c-di-GMP-specific phosphodiesterase class I)